MSAIALRTSQNQLSDVAASSSPVVSSHPKIDLMRQQEISELLAVIKELKTGK